MPRLSIFAFVGDSLVPEGWDSVEYWNHNPSFAKDVAAYNQSFAKLVAGYKESTENYEQHCLQRSLKPLVEDRPNRFHVFEFGGGGAKTDWTGTAAKYLADRLLQPSEASHASPLRRVIVLEGVSKHYFELLGTVLDIPPQFWLSHVDSKFDLDVLDGDSSRQVHPTFIRVRVPQRYGFSSGYEHPSYQHVYTEEAARTQFQLEVGERDFWDHTYKNSMLVISQASYWGKDHGHGSWTALLLVDSPLKLCQEKKLVAEIPGMYRHSSILMRPQRPCHSLPDDSTLYDEIVAAHSSSRLGHTSHAFSGTTFLRNIVRFAWEKEFRLQREQLSCALSWEISTYYADRLMKTSGRHQDLHVRGQLARYLNLILQQDMWAFRYNHLEYYKRQYEREKRRQLKAVKSAADADSDDDSIESQMEKVVMDAKAWEMVAARFQDLEKDIVGGMMAYTQFQSRDEAFTSRLQARSAGQLTKLATVAVPATVVAAIFSMGGDFAVGEPSFFVFWAIVGPITALLMCWVLYEDFDDWFTNRVNRQIHNHETGFTYKLWSVYSDFTTGVGNVVKSMRRVRRSQGAV